MTDTAERNTGQELPDPETLLPGNPFPAMRAAFAPTENDVAPRGHTPGPWVYRPQKYDDWGYVRGPVQDDGFQPFICQAKDARAMDDEALNQHRRAGTDPWEANARLIAASPDMLEALREIDAWSRRANIALPSPLIYAAIAKATGGAA